MTETVDRSQLTTIIAGMTEGVILIEPDQRIVWANAAALAMHGVTVLADLGTDVSDYRARFTLRYRNNHALDGADYPIERVMAGEAFDDVVVEVVPARTPDVRWVHRIRSLVLRDRTGALDCLVLVVTDATERFAAEERFEKTFAANPAPAVICRLSDLRFVKVNQGFVDMTGYGREQVLGRTTCEIDLFNEAANRAMAIERLSEGRTIPQMEAALLLPDGTTRFVIVAGQPIDMGDEPCMLFTFADLERRRKAETALQHSEERFAKAFRLSPVPTVLVKLDTLAYVAVNDAFTTSFGYPEDEVLGRTAADLGLWVKPGQRESFRAALADTGHVAGFEICLRRRDGVDLDCLVSADRVTIADEPCVLSVILDVTERKRSERDLMAAIEAVMADTSWFSRGVIERLAALRQPERDEPDRAASLSARERQILALICEGLTDQTISRRLSLAPNTVRNHVASLYRKLGLHRRSEVVLWGRQQGFSGLLRASSGQD